MVRHFTIIVKSSPPTVEIYVDCKFLGILVLIGPVETPSNNVDVFISQSRPRPTFSGRLAGVISEFFYYPTALTPDQITIICRCRAEAIRPPPALPSTVNVTTQEETRLVMEPTSGVIPVEDAISI